MITQTIFNQILAQKSQTKQNKKETKNKHRNPCPNHLRAIYCDIPSIVLRDRLREAIESKYCPCDFVYHTDYNHEHSRKIKVNENRF